MLGNAIMLRWSSSEPCWEGLGRAWRKHSSDSSAGAYCTGARGTCRTGGARGGVCSGGRGGGMPGGEWGIKEGPCAAAAVHVVGGVGEEQVSREP